MTRPRALVLVATVLLHAAVLLLLAVQRPHASRSEGRRVELRLIAQRPALAPPPPTVPVPPARAATPRQVRAAPVPLTVPAPESAELPASPDPAVVVYAPQPASAPASAPWLDPEKTRQVIRMHGREMAVRDQAAVSSQAPAKVTATERFGSEVQRSANGDCLKGEFLGGGMGLLSAPFWMLAEARGKCRR